MMNTITSLINKVAFSYYTMREVMLIVHFIGLAMFVGTGFAFLFLEIANSKLEKQEHLKFSLRILPLSKMGKIGLALLIFSGGYLMTPYWSVLSELPMLITKLVAVIIICIVIFIMSMYSKKEKSEYYLKKIEPYGKVSFILGIAIVILAIFTFH